ncbi:hypothetical protein NW762_008516 [Fusarium torreyae]|uniref:C2H2-type domain-containing protein n=1 Tax=Fusarium torreyae TaxID=1237075 RepID=A0A9W8RYS0_9HYPO|nr:hypothetical protein NW762_008516 [Fusarium torreyae]
MAPDSWSDADSISQHSHMSHQDDSLDRQLLRHLMRRYGREGIAQLMDEEATSPAISINDGASVISSSTYSSVKSEDAPSIFDAASIRTFSSDNSSTRGSIISNVSARTAKLLGRKSQAARPSTAHEEGTSPASNESSTPAPKQKGSFTCGFCREEDIQKTCTRKNDLKRHIEDFHNTNAQWFCRQKGCDMVFDWQTAYKTHLKQAHGGSRMALDEAKINLCPQTVFACGFENCTQVFEAPSDDDADTVFKEFVAHVVKHFDEGSNSGEWTYSGRMRNLLRQSGLVRAWANSSWAEEERNQLQWHPQSSGILRKRLETRHLGDLQLLVQYAIALGSEPSSITKYREDFINPVKDQCRQVIMGHKSRAPPLPPSGPSPSVDQYQFRISRGNTNPSPNPNLAAYMATQRRAYAARPGPVRSGRSARPPRHTMPATSAAPGSMPHHFQYPNMPTAPMYDPRQQQQQQFAMMQQASGGIIAEDLRSLRSMTNGMPEQDVDMADTDMMDPSFLQDPSFSAPYGPQGITTSAPDGSCLTPTDPMSQHLSFGFDSTYA